ncbi:MAG TPA: hypothetical protein VFR73_15760 [Hyphomicrobiaceae bacterium]|nr:hypothetical protein [Hyphomicrobiaceae bacterium]
MTLLTPAGVAHAYCNSLTAVASLQWSHCNGEAKAPVPVADIVLTLMLRGGGFYCYARTAGFAFA